MVPAESGVSVSKMELSSNLTIGFSQFVLPTLLSWNGSLALHTDYVEQATVTRKARTDLDKHKQIMLHRIMTISVVRSSIPLFFLAFYFQKTALHNQSLSTALQKFRARRKTFSFSVVNFEELAQHWNYLENGECYQIDFCWFFCLIFNIINQKTV